MPDITIPDAAVEAAARADYYNHKVYTEVPFDAYEHRDWWLTNSRIALAAAAPHIAAQERQRVADEIDLPAVMAHLLRGSRDDLILADRINVAIGASRVRRIEAGNG